MLNENTMNSSFAHQFIYSEILLKLFVNTKLIIFTTETYYRADNLQHTI